MYANSYISAATSLHLERYKRQLSSEELLNLSPEELCKDRLSEEYFRLTTEGDCRDVVRYIIIIMHSDLLKTHFKLVLCYFFMIIPTFYFSDIYMH